MTVTKGRRPAIAGGATAGAGGGSGPGADIVRFPGRPPRRPRLPVPLDSFVGRDGARREVLVHLRVSRVVSVVGPGGAGKSRLALEVAGELEAAGHRVVLVDLAPLSDPAAVPVAVAAALGRPGAPAATVADAVADAVAELAEAPVVVLDNCEHLVPACARVVAALLWARRGVRVLATSRERLGVAGEKVWRIPPLSLAAEPALDPGGAGESEAVALFCERAAALRPRYRPGAGDLVAIAEICRRLDGNPLAIELAAVRVGVASPVEIARRLDDPLALLGSGARSGPDRHASLRACLDWSYDRLAPPEQALLGRLAGLAGGFGLAAAEAACGDGGPAPRRVLPLLASLVDKSLVLGDPARDPARFRLPETVRAYIVARREEVADPPEPPPPGPAAPPTAGTGHLHGVAGADGPDHQPVGRRQGGVGAEVVAGVEHLRAAAGGGPGRRAPGPAAGWAALTRAERTVAHLAAAGRTNAQIARQLEVAEATVKAHLRRVFAKVGVDTRTRLAVLVHQGPAGAPVPPAPRGPLP